MLKEESRTSTAWSVRTDRDRVESATRAQLLRAARHVFERRGYASTTVADITTAAHVSRATFYVYFASKAEVFSVLALDVRDRFLAAQEIEGADLSDPYVVTRASVQAFLDAYAENLVFITVIEHQAILNREMSELIDQMLGRPMRRTARYIQRIVEEGRAEPVASPLEVGRAMLGMVAWYAATLRTEPERHDEYVNVLTSMFHRLLALR